MNSYYCTSINTVLGPRSVLVDIHPLKSGGYQADYIVYLGEAKGNVSLSVFVGHPDLRPSAQLVWDNGKHLLGNISPN
jgi:hypothetical protein